MGILVDGSTRVIVQGVTGKQGTFHTRLMVQYGTKVVAGVTPGKGGSNVDSVPVYDTVSEAARETKATSSIIFVPAPAAKDAALEALDNGLNPVVLITEGIPASDIVQLLAVARRLNAVVIGPNTPGIISPPDCKLGIMPGNVFRDGPVGIASRSGTLTYEIASALSEAGLGQSTCLGLGGDPVTGLNFVEVLEMFRNDAKTKSVVMIGEIGGNAEELAAEYIRGTRYPKPVVAYIAGKSAPPGKRMGHAGAIIMGRTGTAESKIQALESSGVKVAELPGEIPALVRASL